MDSERLRDIEELYHAARGCSPEERIALLDRAEPETRREVESLLAQDNAGGLLDRQVALEETTNTQLASGTRLGPYCIEGPLGAGGTRQVYKARDTSLDRAVAIKTISQPVRGRLEWPARASASL